MTRPYRFLYFIFIFFGAFNFSRFAFLDDLCRLSFFNLRLDIFSMSLLDGLTFWIGSLQSPPKLSRLLGIFSFMGGEIAVLVPLASLLLLLLLPLELQLTLLTPLPLPCCLILKYLLTSFELVMELPQPPLPLRLATVDGVQLSTVIWIVPFLLIIVLMRELMLDDRQKLALPPPVALPPPFLCLALPILLWLSVDPRDFLCLFVTSFSTFLPRLRIFLSRCWCGCCISPSSPSADNAVSRRILNSGVASYV